MLDIAVHRAVPLWRSTLHERSDVTVLVTLFNYGHVITDALDSVLTQTLPDVDLVIVDDCSSDGGEQVALDWMRLNGHRFGRSGILRHDHNQGLAAARNQGFTWAATPHVFVLDADNMLYPRCVAECLRTMNVSGAEAVYPVLEVFGESVGLMGTDLWDAERLLYGNFIDAMALVRRAAWLHVGGYRRMPVQGWEDFDFWLKFVENGFEAARVPEILGRYRFSAGSMLRAVTNRSETLPRLQEDLRLHHPDVRLSPIPQAAQALEEP